MAFRTVHMSLFVALAHVASCVRPENLARTLHFGEHEGPSGGCGIEVFADLAPGSTFAGAKALAMAMCQDLYPRATCSAVVSDLWDDQDLAAEFSSASPDFCHALRHALDAAERVASNSQSAVLSEMDTATSRKLVAGRSDGDDLDDEENDRRLRAAAGVPETRLPPPNTSDPVHLFWLGGQSECVGQSRASLLAEDDRPEFAPFKGVPDNIWMASILGTPDNNFYIAPDIAGDKFGPEVGFSRRYHEVTGARVLIIKYCRGGSNVHTQWNPDTTSNSWDYDADNGTAAWLSENGNLGFQPWQLFKTHIYVVRRTIEALTAADVNFEWKGIIWIQGSADRTSTVEEFGQDTARLWDAIRERAVGILDLPIIDKGGDSQHTLRSGKALAAQLAKGCNVVNVDAGGGVEDPESTCVIGPTNPCEDSTFINSDYYNFFGWDPLMPEELRGASTRLFPWFREYPTNLHSEYGGMLLQGVSMANAFIQTFTSFQLTQRMRRTDPVIRFPFPKCAGSQRPGPETFCWIDERAAPAECVKQV